VNVTDRVCVPTLRTVPEAGVYTNVPGTFAVASNCAALRGVEFMIAAGADQVITGVVFAAVGWLFPELD
jgi:FlaA1/EpsC-like NDP-sugar epimerase